MSLDFATNAHETLHLCLKRQASLNLSSVADWEKTLHH